MFKYVHLHICSTSAHLTNFYDTPSLGVFRLDLPNAIHYLGPQHHGSEHEGGVSPPHAATRMTQSPPYKWASFTSSLIAGVRNSTVEKHPSNSGARAPALLTVSESFRGGK